MAIAGSWADDSPENVETAAEAAEAVETVAHVLYATDGQLGAVTMWWGPPIDEAVPRVDGPLRVDLWGVDDRAAVRWLPTGDVGVDPTAEAVETDRTVMESAHEPMVTVPASLIRCTLDTAKAAVVEFVDTGERPTCLQWHATSGMGTVEG